jgi:hypothetical protein
VLFVPEAELASGTLLQAGQPAHYVWGECGLVLNATTGAFITNGFSGSNGCQPDSAKGTVVAGQATVQDFQLQC